MYYGKLLRQMIAALHQVTDSVASGFNRVDERLQQQTTSIHAAQESQNENYEVRQKWDEERLSENQIAKGDQTRRDERNYSVQNSIRWATWIAAIGAWIYGGIAFVQWYDANRNFAIEERAWVTVHENAPIHLQDGDPIEIPISFENTGRTPAFRIQLEAITVLRNPTDRLVFAYEHIPRVGAQAGVLFPDQKQAVEGKATVLELGPDGNLSPAHLLPETHERINKGSLAVFVYGRVSYTDSFGASHWSQFCESGPSERIRPSLSGAVSDCLSYNAVDQ